jgi:predicted Kef-type K+ transport protein
MIRSGLSLTSGLVLGFIVGLTVSATLILLRDFDDSELINQLQTEGANR